MTRFEDVKATFWGDGDYGVQLPITEKAITEAEHELGVRFPSALLDLLRVQNGGQVAAGWNAFATSQPTSWSEDHIPFAELMGIGRRERMRSGNVPDEYSGVERHVSHVRHQPCEAPGWRRTRRRRPANAACR
ncbi:SMI1/KNR4 family protein [Nonomuraea sp. H19]|uniref:SMI1/KNR4 family protein n=1 Tax=Nonomuraea sp. H19 TaxID=3452206 RepID=UPI003F8B5D9F